MNPFTLILAAGSLALTTSGTPQHLPSPKALPDVNASSHEASAHTIDDGFVIVRTQAYFRLNGHLVIITGGIPSKGFRSTAEYSRYIREGVQHHFPGAGTVTYNLDAYGNAVARDMAVTDRQYSTTTFRPAPKPKK